MKRHIALSLLLTLVILILAGQAMSADYQAMTTEQLSQLRGTMYNASEEERAAFRAEWTKRLNQMSAEERQQYLGADSGRGKGNRLGTGLGDGTGRGRGGGAGSLNSSGNSQGNGPGNGPANGSGKSQGTRR